MTRYETRILFVGEIKCPILFQVGNINDTEIIPSVVFFKLNVAKASNNCMGASGKSQYFGQRLQYVCREKIFY